MTGEEWGFIRARSGFTFRELEDASMTIARPRTDTFFYNLTQLQENVPERWVQFLRQVVTAPVFDALHVEYKATHNVADPDEPPPPPVATDTRNSKSTKSNNLEDTDDTDLDH